MRTNAWITLENIRALAWWDWYKWNRDGQEGEEPPLDNWAKNAIRKLGDIEFAFQCFEKATIQSREWRMLCLWDVTQAQVDAGYAQYGDAEQGGDYGAVGFWTWEENPRSAKSQLQPYYNWRPNTVIRYMPEKEQGVPPTKVWDVVLLAGQPPRELPEDTILVQ